MYKLSIWVSAKNPGGGRHLFDKSIYPYLTSIFLMFLPVRVWILERQNSNELGIVIILKRETILYNMFLAKKVSKFLIRQQIY